MTPKEYLDLKLDQAKLKATDSLSMAFGTLLSYILLISVAVIVLVTFAFGVILLIGKLLDNYALGAFIVCALFAIVLVVLWLRRDKMFRNKFVKLFSKQETYTDLKEQEQRVGLMASNAEADMFDWNNIASSVALKAIQWARTKVQSRRSSRGNYDI